MEWDVKAAVCLAVVEREEVFAQLPCLVTFGCRRVLNHHLDSGVQVFCRVFLQFINILFPLVLCLADVDFISLFSHFIIPVHCLDKLTWDAVVCIDSGEESRDLFKEGADAFRMLFLGVRQELDIVGLDG